MAVARGGPQLAAAAEAADAHEARAELSARYQGVLRAQIREPLVPIPYLFERGFGPKALEKVGRAIETVL